MADTEKCIDHVLNYLDFVVNKKVINNGKIWRLMGSVTGSRYYLFGIPKEDNSIILNFLFFTEDYNSLYCSEQNKKDLNVVKGFVESYLKSCDIIYESIKITTSNEILKMAISNFQPKISKERITYIKAILKANIPAIFIIFVVIVAIYFGKNTINVIYTGYPWLFTVIAIILSPLVLKLFEKVWRK